MTYEIIYPSQPVDVFPLGPGSIDVEFDPAFNARDDYDDSIRVEIEKEMAELSQIEGKKVVSHHAHNEHRYAGALVERALSGEKVVVISDAGTPCVSDPGFLVAREAVRAGLEPVCVPGASALTFAAMASGLPVDRFTFQGFPPNKKGARHTLLETIGADDKTHFLYESPKRIKRLLEEVAEVIGPETAVAVVREATKLHEEILRGGVKEVLERIGERNLKGEIVLGINPRYTFA